MWYGSNANKIKKIVCGGDLYYGICINLHKTKGNFVLIDWNKNEYLNIFENRYIHLTPAPPKWLILTLNKQSNNLV